MKQYIAGCIAVIAFFFLAYAGLQTYQNEPIIAVGADLVSPIAGQTYTLAGSGMSSTDTSFTLTSFTITQNNYPIQDSDMSDVFYITLEPGSRARQEIISCTTVGPNTGGPVVISGCTRGLSPITPYTASTSLAFAHSGGSTVIFSDPPQLFNQAAFKNNDETITGNWLIGTPLSSDSIANKAYVDALVSGTTTLSNDRLVVAGTAGETVATGTLVYFNPSTQRWNGVSSASSTTFDDRFIGLTQGAGTNGTAVRNGILLKGRDTTKTGLTPGALYYAAAATGTISTATSSQTLGVAVSATVLYFDPIWIDVPTENGDNVFTGSNTFNFLITGHASTVVRVATTSTTWTKPSGLEYISVWVCAGGGGGSGANGGGGGGGGGGGCAFEILDSTELAGTTSVAMTVGLGGLAGTGSNSGIIGSSSAFGNFLSATGGTGGIFENTGGVGGVGSGGDWNIRGSGGGSAMNTTVLGGTGGSSHFGAGAQGVGGGSAPGEAGGEFGGGGGGGSSTSGDVSGGAGGVGGILIVEYY